MLMKSRTKDYSKVRYYLTVAMRNLELLAERICKSHEFYSELDYLQSSLDLIRNCLYDVKNKYTGQLDLSEAIQEIRQEITCSLKEVKNFDIKAIKYLDNAWSNCKKAEELLK